MTPSHAYVPGQTPRHPEGLFDPIRDTVDRGMTGATLMASDAWQTGLRYYREGYFWECHEVLEAVWLAARQNSDERRMAQAVIQLANAALKARMGRGNAVRRLCDIASAHLGEVSQPACLGVTREWVEREITELRLDNAL